MSTSDEDGEPDASCMKFASARLRDNRVLAVLAVGACEENYFQLTEASQLDFSVALRLIEKAKENGESCSMSVGRRLDDTQNSFLRPLVPPFSRATPPQVLPFDTDW